MALPQLANSLTGLTEFSLFSKLPSELRAMVWKLAANEPRVIIPTSGTGGHLFGEIFRDGRRVRKSVPAMLHANQEARYIGLKFYTLSFGTRLQKGPIYFNFKIDALYFDRVHAFESFKNAYFQELHHSPQGIVRPQPPETQVQHLYFRERDPYVTWRVILEPQCEYLSTFVNLKSAVFEHHRLNADRLGKWAPIGTIGQTIWNFNLLGDNESKRQKDHAEPLVRIGVRTLAQLEKEVGILP